MCGVVFIFYFHGNGELYSSEKDILHRWTRIRFNSIHIIAIGIEHAEELAPLKPQGYCKNF